MLERWGRRVVEASDGREALEKTVEHRPDLVVMDLSMPIADSHIAVLALDRILRRMQTHQRKKRPMLRPLKTARNFGADGKSSEGERD